MNLHQPPHTEDSADMAAAAESKAVLTNAIRQLDLVHVTLLGLVGIVVMLFVGVALPVLNMEPIKSAVALLVMGMTATAGIAYLYWLNLRVHKSVTEQARLTEVLVNSLGQGFLTFDRNGFCGPVYSQACVELLEMEPAGKPIHSVLGISDSKRDDFYSWLEVLFDPTHALGFDDAVKFLPDSLSEAGGRHIHLSYKPVRDRNERLIAVVLIATDKTDELVALAAAKKQQDYAAMIVRVFQERNQFVITLKYIREFIDLARQKGNKLAESAGLLRQLHTIKGAVKHFNLVEFGDVVHRLEDDLRNPDIMSDATYQAALARAADAIEVEMNSVLLDIKGLINEEEHEKGNVYQIGEDKIYDFIDTLQAQGASEEIIGTYCEQIASIPLRECFSSFARELRELSQKSDKQIHPLQYVGDNPRILVRPMADFFFSLTHVCRNIVDHGIEAPVTRMARGKDPSGRVTINTALLKGASYDRLKIDISDDGNGIDPTRIRQKLAVSDPNGNWRLEDDKQLIQRIFDWGLSTREGANELSGRGVGMEVVMQEVKRLGGTIKVTSEIYVGTTFEIIIPLPHMQDYHFPLVAGQK